MALYVAKEPIPDDPVIDDTGVDPDTGNDGNIDTPIDPVIDPDTEEPVDPPEPGWSNTPPEYGMMWAERSHESYPMATIRNYWLNKAAIAPVYQVDKQAVMIDPGSVTQLLDKDTEFDISEISTGTFKDNDGDGDYDSYTNSNRNIEVLQAKVYNTTEDPSISSSASELFNDPAGDTVIVNGVTPHIKTFYVDPAQSQSYGSALVWTNYTGYVEYPVNAFGNEITKPSDGDRITTVQFQFGRGDFKTAYLLNDGEIITNVKIGADGNRYFYIGVSAHVNFQTTNNSPDKATVRLLINTSKDTPGVYKSIAEEEWYTPVAADGTPMPRNRDIFCGVWLPADDYDGETVRFEWEIEFDVGSDSAFVVDYTGTYKMVDYLNGIDIGSNKRLSRVGLYLNNPKQSSEPFTSIALKRSIKGAGMNLRYSYGLPITSGDSNPDWWAALNDTNAIAEYTTEGEATTTLMEGALVSSGDLTIGEYYVIVVADTASDFTNVGSANNALGTGFQCATEVTPDQWGNAQLLHVTTDLIGYVFADADKPLCLWIINKKDYDASYSSIDIQAISGIELQGNGEALTFNNDEQYKVAVKGTDGNYYGILVLESE